MGTIDDLVLSTAWNLAVGVADGYLSGSGDFNTIYTVGSIGASGVVVFGREYFRHNDRLTGDDRVFHDGSPSGQATTVGSMAAGLSVIGAVVGYGIGYSLR